MIRLAHAAAIALVLASGAADAATRAVVIGVDAYADPALPRLSGAVADARDIARVLAARGAGVRLLVDGAATRDAVIAAFRQAVAASGPGDTVILSFAGLGVQTPEGIPGDEIDGLDESLALSGFSPSGPGAGERLRDNDLAGLLAGVPPGVTVMLVLDAGTSGAETRAAVAGMPDHVTRWGGIHRRLPGDPLPAPDPATVDREPTDFPNVVLITAATDRQGVPELAIDGAHRGALSWAMARAFSGMASGGDGRTSMEELRLFVRQQVRALAGAMQTPEVAYPVSVSRSLKGLSGALAGLDAVLDGVPLEPVADRPAADPLPDGLDIEIPLPRDVAAGSAAGKVDGAAFDLSGLFGEDRADERLAAVSAASDLVLAQPLTLSPVPTLAIRGGATPEMGPSVTVVATEAEAQLIWDRAEGQLYDPRTGDALAAVADAAQAEAAILKWRAVEGLARWAPLRATEMALEPGDGRHAVGGSIRLVVTKPDEGFDHLTIVNLASGGEVQFVTATTIPRGISRHVIGPVPVVPPLGADMVIAVVSTRPLNALNAALGGLDGRPAPDRLLKALREHASDIDTVRIGLQPMFTTD